MTCRSALGTGRRRVGATVCAAGRGTLRRGGACEFACCECGRHIVLVVGEPLEPPLCGACMTIPGWLQIPAFREIPDPEGTIREPDYAALPTWGP